MENLADTVSQKEFETAVSELLAATESLYQGVSAEGEQAATLDSAFERRERGFRILQSLVTQGMSPNAAARACLARVRDLDREMLRVSADQAGEIRSARYALHRRRSAVQAHGSRERGEPRLVTVKA